MGKKEFKQVANPKKGKKQQKKPQQQKIVEEKQKIDEKIEKIQEKPANAVEISTSKPEIEEKEQKPTKTDNKNKKSSNDDEKALDEIKELAETASSSESVVDDSVTFAELGLDPILCETLEKKLNYKHPSKIQVQALPMIIKNPEKDFIGIAETGSGKTAAFVLPILHLLLSEGKKVSPCSALIVTPTRELAMQIKDHVAAMGSDIELKTLLLVSSSPEDGKKSSSDESSKGNEKHKDDLFMQQQKIIQTPELRPHIVIGTPGRIYDHLQHDKSFTLFHTKYIVLDEADNLLSIQYKKYMDAIFEKSDPEKRKIHLWSATMTTNIEKLKQAKLRDPMKAQIASSRYATVSTLQQYFLFVPEKFKELYLVYVLNENAGKRILVFTSQNKTCMYLYNVLKTLGFSCLPLAGDMQSNDRINSLRQYKSGERPILVATDVAARGLDIPMVEMVINYEIPTVSKEYIHRVGRTARIGKKGVSITFASQYDIEYFKQIEKLIEKKMDEYPTKKEDVMVLVDSVSAAEKAARSKLKTIMKEIDENKKTGSNIPSKSKKRKRGGDDDNENEENDALESLRSSNKEEILAGKDDEEEDESYLVSTIKNIKKREDKKRHKNSQPPKKKPKKSE